MRHLRRIRPQLLRYASTKPDPPKFAVLDAKWRKKWADEPPSNDAKDFLVLPMFPYPSGILHMGHLRVYTIADVLARYHRMLGKKVIHPMAWDAFGLPAENAAIERAVNPAVWTRTNIAKMKDQLELMNGSWDWSREFATCDPSFYKHTQKLFLKLHEKGLAYQAESYVNYDPVDKTVLANEQVDAAGRSWRSGALVEKKLLKQWYLRITAYKEELLRGLDTLKWPTRVLQMQKNWIGKSKGAKIKFYIVDGKSKERYIEVFTTRPETIFGVQYIALAAEHPIAVEIAKRSPVIKNFVDRGKGCKIPSLMAVNPAGEIGTRGKLLPIYIAPYVLSGYGEGAVMGVPAHDERDRQFWEEQGGTPLAVIEDGKLNEHCASFAELETGEAAEKIMAALKKKGLGEITASWRLRDWLVSRQRYWGTPIPIIHCESCGAVPVPDDQLPVELPEMNANAFREKFGNVLEATDWVNTTCPSCDKPAKRETDTMDTFVDSSWYYMRFREPDADELVPATKPVSIYIGGIEHAILHLLYARFISLFLSGIEPFEKLVTQGMVHGKTYSDPDTGRFLKLDEVDFRPKVPVIHGTIREPLVSYEKMSKSKHNGVDPTVSIEKYGADVVRAHMLFQAPVAEILDWDEQKIVGIQRWFAKIWNLVHDLRDVDYDTSDAVREVTRSMEKISLNTVISSLTKLTNGLQKQPSREGASVLLRMLAPVAPAFAEECWAVFNKGSVFDQAWPAATEASQKSVIAVQINGKFRFSTDNAETSAILETEEGKKWLVERNDLSKLKKRVLIPGRAVNYVF